MKYEIKNLKEFYGRDGGGLECSLYRDGKKVATVFNDGCGGCNNYFFANRDIEQEVIAEMRTLAIAIDPSLDGWEEAEDEYIEHLIDCKENNRLAKNAVLFRKDATKIFEAFQAKNVSEADIRAKYPNAVVWSIAQQAWV